VHVGAGLGPGLQFQRAQVKRLVADDLLGDRIFQRRAGTEHLERAVVFQVAAHIGLVALAEEHAALLRGDDARRAFHSSSSMISGWVRNGSITPGGMDGTASLPTPSVRMRGCSFAWPDRSALAPTACPAAGGGARSNQMIWPG
jgi:hypothetical protein